MDKEHQDSITKNLVALCRDLVLEPLLTLLIQAKIFSGIDLQYIMAERTDYERNRKVCFDLKRKGPTAFNIFIDALVKTDQVILARNILLTEYNLRNGTKHLRFDDIPGAAARMEGEGGGQSKQGRTSKGRPVVQPSDDPANTHHQQQPISKQTHLNAAAGGLNDGSGDHTDSDRYKMESDPRGYMLIINNKVFEHLGHRTGTDKDLQELETVFSRLGYEVEVKHNLKAEVMKSELAVFASKAQHKNVDSSVVAILSHGVLGAVCGTDSEKISEFQTTNLVTVKEMEEMFNGDKCPLLMNKPKLFILQSCRGESEDEGVWESDAPITDNQYAEKLKQERRRLCAPTYADMIFAYATIPDYKAYRNTVHGSPYIQILCRIFNSQSLRLHVVDMLTLVTKDCADQDMSNKDDIAPIKMVPQKTDTLRKFWFLNPKFIL